MGYGLSNKYQRAVVYLGIAVLVNVQELTYEGNQMFSEGTGITSLLWTLSLCTS